MVTIYYTGEESSIEHNSIVNGMSYIERAKREFIGHTDHEIWKTIGYYISSPHLRHPANTPHNILKQLLPNLEIDEILLQVSSKQKEIAHRVDSSQLPSDRPPGFIGQAALFAVLRERNADFSYYLNVSLDELGFSFFRYLANASYIMQFLDYPLTEDIILPFFTRVDESRHSARYEDMWYDRINRIYEGSFLGSIDFFRSNQYRDVIENLVGATRHNSLNISNISKWVDCSRRHANLLYNVITRSGSIFRGFIPVLKKLNLTRTMEEGTHGTDSSLELSMRCRHLATQKPTSFYGRLIDFNETDLPLYSIEGEKLNTNLYSRDKKRWEMSESYLEINTMQSLLDCFNKITPMNTTPIKVSSRDMYAIGALRIFRGQSIETFLTDNIGLTANESHNALRNVFRRGLVIPIYRPQRFGPHRVIFAILSGSSRDVIRSLGQIIQVVPYSTVRFSETGSDAYLFSYIPDTILTQALEALKLINENYDTFDGPYELEHFKSSNFSSILNLIQ